MRGGQTAPFLPLARNQGANAPPGLPLVSPLVRETNGMARPPPGRARLRPWPAEIRWEGLRDKVPRTSGGAPSRGRGENRPRLFTGRKRSSGGFSGSSARARLLGPGKAERFETLGCTQKPILPSLQIAQD